MIESGKPPATPSRVRLRLVVHRLVGDPSGMAAAKVLWGEDWSGLRDVELIDRRERRPTVVIVSAEHLENAKTTCAVGFGGISLGCAAGVPIGTVCSDKCTYRLGAIWSQRTS